MTFNGVTLANCTGLEGGFANYVNDNEQFQYYDEKKKSFVTLFTTDSGANQVVNERTFPFPPTSSKRWRLYKPHGYVATGYLKFVK